MSLVKKSVLLIAIKHSRGHGGEDVTPLMESIVNKLSEGYGDKGTFTGLPLDDDKKHDDKLRNTLANTKFDIISFGGGIKHTSKSWAERVQDIIDNSQCKDAKITNPTSPQNAVELVIEEIKKGSE